MKLCYIRAAGERIGYTHKDHINILLTVF